MFSFSGLLTRERRSVHSGQPRPADHLVHKDGMPFAILNATPALAARTVAGFRLAVPEAHWSYQLL
ncbi:hypothetical protein [Magnetospirillum sp. UT-4]|uniref:hypothetical protein n=1 Tax=Magnetospirillum sp. UT-4 TaxID=2681467 RepID=UPI0013801CC4|nr:hypothetical protein [Magnetospirillum sp. UT-4]CAA7626486.1 hypothetical protein MTBUT4_80067 [Magnetospirillum sp. UT-4]